VLHGLLHMIGAGEPVTSDSLAQAMATNPGRRPPASWPGCASKVYVRSEKGHGAAGRWPRSAAITR